VTKLIPATTEAHSGSIISSDTEETPAVDELDALLNSDSETEASQPASKKRGMLLYQICSLLARLTDSC
jgi:hypothetical protein